MSAIGKSRWVLPTFFALCCAGAPAFGQASQAQAPLPAPKRDLTVPQAQPSLTVDTDPILSPDLGEKPHVVVNEPTPTAPGKGTTGERALKKEGNGFVLQANVNEVLLPCTVIDDKGRLVTDLTKANFQVWEDKLPQTIASFQHQDVPVSLGILIDNSGSMRDKRSAINDATLHLVRASNPADNAFVVNFSDRAVMDQGFTSDVHLIQQGLSHIDSRGSTALYDAVVASANQMARHATHQKQVLLIITDGEDNASRLTLAQAIRRVQSLDGPVVYAIGLLYEDLTRDEAAKARSDLQSLALETGGVAYFPNSLSEVDQIATQVARDLRNQYTIGYHSTKDASLGGYRTVHVEAHAPKRGEMTVRTRRGYFPNQIQQQQTAQVGH